MTVASFVSELGLLGGDAGVLVLGLLLGLPIVLSSLALAIVYRVLPPVRPRRSAFLPPAVTIGVGLVVLTRVFAVVAPRALGANFVYGTLGAILQKLPDLPDGTRVLGFNYDTGERYLSVPDFLPES